MVYDPWPKMTLHRRGLLFKPNTVEYRWHGKCRLATSGGFWEVRASPINAHRNIVTLALILKPYHLLHSTRHLRLDLADEKKNILTNQFR